MHVEEADSPGVDECTQRRVTLVRRAKADGLSLGEHAVDGWASGSAGEDANFEGPAGRVLGCSAFGEGDRDLLSGACRGEGAEAYGLAVLNHRCGFLGV